MKQKQYFVTIKYLDQFGKERDGETKIFDSKERAEQYKELLSLRKNETVVITEVFGSTKNIL